MCDKVRRCEARVNAGIYTYYLMGVNDETGVSSGLDLKSEES
jgi:hypothetical protein